MFTNRLEIDTPNMVLVDFQTGAFCLDPSTDNGAVIKDLPPQKNGTCWWYALMLLGMPHFSHIDMLKPFAYLDEVNQIILAEKRQMLKTSYKNALADLNKQRDFENDYLKSLVKNGAIDRAEAAEIRTFERDKHRLLKDFIDQDKELTLDTFCKKRNLTKRIEIARSILEKMGYDPDEQRSIEHKNCFPNKEYSQLTLEEKVLLYHQTVKNLFIRDYKLKASPWHPTNDIHGLIDNIRQFGMHVSFGFNGLPYHPLKDEKDSYPEEKGLHTRHRIFYLEENRYDMTVQRRGSHAVDIMGAAKIKGKNYVIIHDPKQGSIKTDSDVTDLYLISFENFCSRVSDIHGNHLKQKSSLKTYAVYADQETLFLTRQSYLNTMGLFKLLEKFSKEASIPRLTHTTEFKFP